MERVLEAVRLPGRKDQRPNPRFDKAMYRRRNVVERCVLWLKESRRLATRHEKLAVSFLAMAKLAMIQLMATVVLGVKPSVRAAYPGFLGKLVAQLTAVYKKLKGVEAGICRAPGRLPGYRAKVLDVNHLAGTEHRVPENRMTRSAALLGQASSCSPRPPCSSSTYRRERLWT